MIFAAAGIAPPLRPDDSRATAARRPRYSALSNHKMEGLGIAPMPRLDAAIGDYLEKRLVASTS
jgi:dTDP-4-dehydrorhamnose reductase